MSSAKAKQEEARLFIFSECSNEILKLLRKCEQPTDAQLGSEKIRAKSGREHETENNRKTPDHIKECCIKLWTLFKFAERGKIQDSNT